MNHLKKALVLYIAALFLFVNAMGQYRLPSLKIVKMALPPAAKFQQLKPALLRLTPIEESSALPESCFQFGVQCSALPVQLLDFTAARTDDKTAALTWKTELESNLNGYYIERSLKPSAGFTERGFIPANGAGAVRNEYHFNDNNALAVTSYYRLRISHSDGNITYSEVRPVKPIKETTVLLLYPSPASVMLNLRITVPKNTSALFIWNDAAGKKVKYQSRILQAGINTFTENVSGLANGSYFISIQTNDGVNMVGRFFKVK